MRDINDDYIKFEEMLFGEHTSQEMSFCGMTGCRCCHQMTDDKELDKEGMCEQCSEERILLCA